jgi:hypothetical protein
VIGVGTALTAIVVGVVLGVTLSGGNSGPTKAQYTAKADAICKTATSQAAPLIKQITPLAASLATGATASAQKLASLLGQLHTDTAGDLARLRALAQPSSDHAAINRFLKPLTSVVDAIATAASTLRGSNPAQALGGLEQLQPTAGQVTSAAHAYGLTQCGQLFSALG